MQFQYLGTAAAEGWPAVFCRCKYCLEAQRLGGKNIRTRSQAIVNDDLLLDLCLSRTFTWIISTRRSSPCAAPFTALR